MSALGPWHWLFLAVWPPLVLGAEEARKAIARGARPGLRRRSRHRPEHGLLGVSTFPRGHCGHPRMASPSARRHFRHERVDTARARVRRAEAAARARPRHWSKRTAASSAVGPTLRLPAQSPVRPASTSPRFITQIADGDPGAAAATILAENILGGTCARVCPVEVLCEGACVLEHEGRPPIAIGALQRYAMDRSSSSGLPIRAKAPRQRPPRRRHRRRAGRARLRRRAGRARL